VDDYRTSGPSRRGADQTVGQGRTPDADPVYDWGGKPGEDFGPMPAPPGAAPVGGASPETDRRPGPAPDRWAAEPPAAPPAPQPAAEPHAPRDEPAAPERIEDAAADRTPGHDPSPDDAPPSVDDDNTASLPRPEPRPGERIRVDEWTRAVPPASRVEAARETTRAPLPAGNAEWTRTAPLVDRAQPGEPRAYASQADTSWRTAGPADPWDGPHAGVPIDVDVDDAASVRRSVGLGSVPLGGRRQRGRPFAGLLALLLVFGLLVGVVLAVLSRQNAPATQSAPPVPAPAAGAASPGASPGSGLAILPIATSTVLRAGPSPVLTFTPAAVVLDEPTPDAPAATAQAAASPEPTLTPLALGPPSGSPLPGHTRAATPTPRAIVRASPAAVVPDVPPLVTLPPGIRFPTSTPIRTTAPTRTPPPIPTVRPLTFYTRIWSEQTLHRQGDDASICGQATTGANAEMFVLGPDRATTSLGQFTPPAERVCTTLKLDTAGLYVLTLIVKDAGGTETDRQSAALYVGR